MGEGERGKRRDMGEAGRGIERDRDGEREETEGWGEGGRGKEREKEMERGGYCSKDNIVRIIFPPEAFFKRISTANFTKENTCWQELFFSPILSF